MPFSPKVFIALALLGAASSTFAQDGKPFDAAAAFGARTDIEQLRLSPDGNSIAFLRPIQGQGSVLYTQSLAPGATAKVAYFADGKPFRLRGCNWVANDRLVCAVYGVVNMGNNLAGLLPITRLVAVNADGTKPQQLGVPEGQQTRGIALTDSAVIDWLPDQDGSVLMIRAYVPGGLHPGTDNNNQLRGVGVDEVDTRTLAVKHVIPPREGAFDYISDGRGTVRILGETHRQPGGIDTGIRTFLYRTAGSYDWRELSTYNQVDHSGFLPAAVDHDLNIAYGWKKLNGRTALYSLSLDGNLREQVVYSRPDVDLNNLMRIGRRNRVVGVSYSTDLPSAEFFADDIKQLRTALHAALPKRHLVSIVDSSADESKLLVFARSDIDPGAYYILDQHTHSLKKLLGTRAQLESVTLANVTPITYPATDGTMIPAYLTLPPGVDNPHGLPAIVLPHGGPSARDEWGFDWLAQFYAARGYIVLQPNFRGSTGYGDGWYLSNGYKSWPTAIGDVVDAGRWLVKQGMADPAKLGIVGWSYGGYAALQSVDLEPGLFKAIVAIAPVTDLAALKSERGFWSDYFLASDFIGSGDTMRDGSPVTHAAKFKQPVLLFHGTMDRNVSVEESRKMEAALKAAGGQVQLVTFDDRDHQIDDSSMRADMLRQSDAFFRKAFGMTQ